MGVDNNVFNTVDDPQRDVTADIGPRVAYWLRMGKARLSGISLGQYLYFKDFASERSWSTNQQGRIDVRLGRIAPFVDATYRNSRERPGFEIDARAHRREWVGGAGSEIRVSPKTTLVLSGSRETFLYDNEEAFLGVNLANTLNRHTDLGRVQLRYTLTPLTTFVMNADALRDRFDSTVARDADSLRVMPGFELKPLALISGTAAVGFRRFNVLDGSTEDFSGVTAAVNARYSLHSTQFGLKLNRDLSYSFEQETPYYALTDVTVEITERLSRAWDVLARGGRQTLAYRRASSTSGADRTDHGVVYGAGIHYRLGDTAQLGVDGNYYRRDAASTVRNYDGLRIGASVTYGSRQ